MKPQSSSPASPKPKLAALRKTSILLKCKLKPRLWKSCCDETLATQKQEGTHLDPKP